LGLLNFAPRKVKQDFRNASVSDHSLLVKEKVLALLKPSYLVKIEAT